MIKNQPMQQIKNANLELDKPLSIDILIEIRSTWKILGSVDFLKFLKDLQITEINLDNLKLNTQIYVCILNVLCKIGEEEFIKKIIAARFVNKPNNKHETLEIIIKCVCDHFKYDYSHLINKNIRAEQRGLALIILSVLATEYKYSYLEIGIAINRSQTRVNTYISTFLKMKSDDKDKKFIESNIQIIKNKLDNGNKN